MSHTKTYERDRGEPCTCHGNRSRYINSHGKCATGFCEETFKARATLARGKYEEKLRTARGGAWGLPHTRG